MFPPLECLFSQTGPQEAHGYRQCNDQNQHWPPPRPYTVYCGQDTSQDHFATPYCVWKRLFQHFSAGACPACEGVVGAAAKREENVDDHGWQRHAAVSNGLLLGGDVLYTNYCLHSRSGSSQKTPVCVLAVCSP